MSLTRQQVKDMDVILEGHYQGQQRAKAQPEVVPFNNTLNLQYQTLEDAFPDGVAPKLRPLGTRLVVQVRRPQTMSEGGIVLAPATRANTNWNQQIARVTRMGPLCFRNRETGELWPESDGCKVGDFVRVPRWSGDRMVCDAPDGGLPVQFVVFNDHEIIGVVEGDPLSVKIYIL